MNNEMIVCIPGAWESRKDFLSSVVETTDGEFMLAAMILAHPKGRDHVELEFAEPYDRMAEAFSSGGRGKLSDETLKKIEKHLSVIYLHFPLDMTSQRLRLVKFTEVVSRCGGIAVKIENSGIAHEWERWFSLLRSDNPFDSYCASVVLSGDQQYYYSCGMHNFGLPDAQTSSDFDTQEAADLLNQFNYYQVLERPRLESGHTFSLTAGSPRFRVNRVTDQRHQEDELFHNPHGLWDLAG